MTTNQIFEACAKRLWPLIRPWVKRSERCKRCILSAKHSPLTNGICETCRIAERRRPGRGADAPTRAQRLFDAVIRTMAQGERYDAMLLLSGGKDSAYILHRMRSEYPDLRILCAVVNNGFMSPLAIEGARHTAAKLGTDLLVINSEVERFKETFRKAFLDLKGRGAYGVIDKADGDLIFEIGRAAALERGIPVMLAGLSWVQLKMIFGTDDFKLQQEEGVLSVFPLAAWRTDEVEIRKYVRERGLLPPGGDSPIASNSDLVLPMSVLDVLNLGYSSFEPEFAQLVREGKTDRRTWLHTFELLEFAVQKGLLDRDFERSLGALGLSRAEVAGVRS